MHSTPRSLRLSLLIATGLAAFSVATAHAQQSQWGDQGDGTYKNPVLPSDYSDPDVIRVGSDYYLVTSTFQYSGGVAVLHSKDMVNWETISHAIPDVSVLGTNFNWSSMSKYGTGVYAPSIRYRPSNSTFYVYVNCYGSGSEGFWVCTATNPAGPWTVTQLRDKNGAALRTSGWTDPCPIFDDVGGKAYLATSNPGGSTKGCFLFQMSLDGTQLLDADVTQASTTMGGTRYWPYGGTEGNKIYKWNGYYYLFNVDFQGNGPSGVGCYMKRSTNIYGTGGSPGTAGTYEVVYYGNSIPTQGAFVDSPDGSTWYYIAQFNAYDYTGRNPNLLPATWINNFPWPGSPAGSMVTSGTKPVAGQPVLQPQGSDEFSSTTLLPQWEWNYQPRSGYWSLSERPGFLRLKAWPALTAGTFSKAGDTISQRVVGKQGGEVVTKMDVGNMASGQTAGLCVYWLTSSYCTFGVVQSGTTRTIQLNNNGTTTTGPALSASAASVWLRTSISDQGSGTFSYSLDGTNFIPIAGSYPFGVSNYRGTRFGLYCYNDTATAGSADFDFFHYTYGGPLNGAPPASLAATAGNAKATLNWTASTGATGYNVKRALAGGAFTTVAGNVPSNSFIDANLTNGATYYYSVAAIYPASVSTDSAAVTAIPLAPVYYAPNAYLRLDETSGTTAVDSSGNGRTGTLLGGPTWAAGKINNAVNLSGTSQYVSFPTGVVSGLTDFTIAAWVKVKTLSTWARVFDFGTGQTAYMMLVAKSSTGNPRFAITTSGGSGEQQINASSALAVGVWTHLAVTRSGSTGTLYINGVQAGQNTGMTLSPSSLGGTTLNYIGKSQFSDPYLGAAVDDFRIYNRSLNASDIAILASPPAAPTGVTAAPLDAKAAVSWTAVPDVSGYSVKRATTSGGPYTDVATRIANTSYTDTALTNGIPYYYVVTSFTGVGESENSGPANTTPVAPPPPAPTGLTVTAGNGQVTLTWTTSAGATIYNVLRGVAAGSYTLVGTSTSTTYVDSTAANGTAYFYQVTASSSGGTSSGTSTPTSVTPLDTASIPAPTISVTSGGANALVSIPSASGWTYHLQRSDSLDTGSWTEINSKAGTGGTLIFADNPGTGIGKRFYRINLTP